MNLLTIVDVKDRDSPHLYVKCTLFLETHAGGRLPLLVDRGWATNQSWEDVRLEEIVDEAPVVVGPDAGGSGDEEALASGHWEFLTARARAEGVNVSANEMRTLPHHVELTEQLKSRLAKA
ncbi:hypothetical protein [Serinicoccus chungangensis]|uniref:hypothetical protein n=1 Tax=Serinicoccus chungangensis TaxID=767452 RepID=UPI00128EFE2D|nr:hypothetical protein [Serinicoccus chungangensis]